MQPPVQQAEKVDIFYAALGVNIDVLLGNSPPPPMVDIYRTFCKDMWKKGQLNMDCVDIGLVESPFQHTCL
jgi:hypothetical protein